MVSRIRNPIEWIADQLGSTFEYIESTGETRDCRIQTTLRPADGSTLVTIRYGAGCPPPAG